jgi:hypothetical protein
MKQVKFLKELSWAKIGEIKIIANTMADYMAKSGTVKIVEDLGSYNSPENIFRRKFHKLRSELLWYDTNLFREQKIALVKETIKSLNLKIKDIGD